MDEGGIPSSQEQNPVTYLWEKKRPLASIDAKAVL